MAKKYTKNYVGKRKKVENLDIVRISINVEDLLKHKYEYKGVEYVTLEVAKMQSIDKFNNIHTAYVSVKEEETVEAK